MSLGVKKAEAVSDLICILVFDDMKLKLITGILQCCDAYFADLAYVSVKYMPRQQKMTIRVNVRVNININWISPLLRDHSHCKENCTIFSRPLKFQNTFLKWPCFYSRHCIAETLSIWRETPLIQSIIDLTEACGPPPHVERAFHDSEGILRFPTGSQVQYRCQEGFMLTERHANTRALCIHPRWEGLRMSCKRQYLSPRHNSNKKYINGQSYKVIE